MSSQPDIIIAKDEVVTPEARQRIIHNSISFYIASGFVMLWGLAAMGVILHAYFMGKEPPTWAVGLESSTITAALAIVFKDQIPSGAKPKADTDA